MTTFRIAAVVTLLSFTTLARSNAKKDTSNEVQLQCADGSMGKAGRGACSRHGGVAKNAETRSSETTTTTRQTRATPAPEPQQAPRESEQAPRQSQQAPRPADDSPSRASQDTKPTKSPWSIFGTKPQQPQGRTADRPTREAPANAPNIAPTAKCRDGSLSYSAHHSGSCSHHGGVAQFLDAR